MIIGSQLVLKTSDRKRFRGSSPLLGAIFWVINPLKQAGRSVKSVSYDSSECDSLITHHYCFKEVVSMNCIVCGKPLNTGRKYCSQACTFAHRDIRHKERNSTILKEWLDNNLSHCLVKKGPEVGEILSRVKIEIIKPYILDQQDHKCAICHSLDIHNDKPLIFILDHIDGDWNNNYRDNLRMICPNCNSQLDTTKHNRGNGRYATRYYQKVHRDSLK